jgi:hypothetical protein
MVGSASVLCLRVPLPATCRVDTAGGKRANAADWSSTVSGGPTMPAATIAAGADPVLGGAAYRQANA